LKEAYAAWVHGDGGAALRRAAQGGHRHFSQLARAALALHAGGPLPGSPAAGAAAAEALLTAPSAVCAG
jgi:hypothetical protein